MLNESFTRWYPDTLVHRIPKVSHMYYLLRDARIGRGFACFSDTVTAHVPYYGGLIEVDRDFLLNRGM